MFKEDILETLAVNYEKRIIIYDLDDIESRYSYSNLLSDLGFEILYYKDATYFRYIFENRIKYSGKKFAVIINGKQYVPYDIIKKFYCSVISWNGLFPNLNKEALIRSKDIDLSLLYSVTNRNQEDMSSYEETKLFIKDKVYTKENVKVHLKIIEQDILDLLSDNSLGYKGWIEIAIKKARAEYLAARSGLTIDFSFIDEKFKYFILEDYKMISSTVNKKSPILVSRIMDYIFNLEKVALIVLDGMSIFDFNIISSEFNGIEYQENYIFAMVPTTTSISRQSLLSGKFPVELDKPFNLSREEKEFKEKARSLGYADNQILYTRGYQSEIGPNVKCLSIIINDVDDLVHGQLQGRVGMYNDIHYLATTGKLQKLIGDLYKKDFRIYLTSDHGNTLCRGLGSVSGTGVEIETKSKRMLILKDFAQSNELIEKYNLIEYPGYYMDKQYQYLICNTGTSFDKKDNDCMNHGGFSIDKVVVPFIKIKAVHD